MPQGPSLPKLLAHVISDLKLEKPVARSALVLSPHPDDDVIGCGGTLARLVGTGCRVTVLYLTDGSKGDPSGTRDKTLLAEVRENEAKAACKILGVQNQIFLRRPDGDLRADDKTVDETIAVLQDTEPELVYLPSLFDGFFHSDHLQTNMIFDKVVTKEDACFTCYGYEVYTPLIPNSLVDISSVADFKTRAIEQHKTQIRMRTYSKILELNRYRAAMLGPIGSSHVEAFLNATPDDYHELFRTLFDMPTA